MTNRTITWLHLSDLHFRESTQWEMDIVLNALRRDVLQKLADEDLRPDMIFATGDIAYSGASQEYSRAQSYFEKISTELDIQDSSRWFIVPGNHDVDRHQISDPVRKLLERQAAPTDVNTILCSADFIRLFTKRQQEFFLFARRFLGKSCTLSEERPWAAHSLAINNIKLSVLSLNSAWTAEGGTLDQGRILLGEYQVRNTLMEAASHGSDIQIALLHHPLSWLRDFDQAQAEALLFGPGGVQFLLRGHLHSSQIRQLASPDARCLEIAAGACWDGARFPHGITVVQLNLETGRGTIHLWRFSPEGRGFWKRDNFLYERVVGGRWTFPLARLGINRTVKKTTPRKPKITAPFDSSSTATVDNPTVSDAQQTPTRASLRRFVLALLRGDSDFDAFCLDYFPDIEKRFSDGMDSVRKMNFLLKHADEREILAHLQGRYPREAASHTNMLRWIPKSGGPSQN